MTTKSMRHDIFNNPHYIGSNMHLVATPNAFVGKQLRSTDEAWSSLGLMWVSLIWIALSKSLHKIYADEAELCDSANAIDKVKKNAANNNSIDYAACFNY
jgi:hypothetical protein